MTGGSLHEDSKAADQQALVSTTTVDSLRIRAWLVAVLVVWQIEAITLVVMQLWTGAAQARSKCPYSTLTHCLIHRARH